MDGWTDGRQADEMAEMMAAGMAEWTDEWTADELAAGWVVETGFVKAEKTAAGRAFGTVYMRDWRMAA